ncbi:acyl-CoA dehydrogenase family protein [Jiangella alba]|uniref:Acyl-CoA dehydrogenase n=1 Tax=Jiangella alba TaxID=561176 RepID=A0A1H5L3U3_9ACTN|nr:acyl-CoA dehydrogenase family protein [Jiangella alba]SEE71716.1 Acyl-CoA dehydrogenase [Jiangella alba]
MTTPEPLERFTPIFERIRAGAAQRERDRVLPRDEVRELAAAGFGALRLPPDGAGRGVSLTAFFELLIRLGAADSNLPQIWRNHIAFVEDRLQPGDGRSEHWRKVLAGGAVVGGAWSERGTATGQSTTTLTEDDGGWRLTGTKYYSTGSLFADWISVTAPRGDDHVVALVDATADGVEVVDDWTGIGQRTTASGTARFTGVAVDETGIYPFHDRAPYQEAVYQLVHLATLAGTARGAHLDLVDAVRARSRSYKHGLAESAREDAQVLAVVGRVAAAAFAAEAAVLRAAAALDGVADLAIAGGHDADALAPSLHAATITVYEAQVAVTELVLQATTLLYDALSASALDAATLLDRHWRNARTVTSHNPRIYKERLVGNWHVNAVPPSLGFDRAGAPGGGS